MAGKTNIKELARRYVTAMLELADTDSKLKKIAKDFEKVEDMIAKSEAFNRMVKSPIVNAEGQVKAISEIAKKAKLEKVTENFLKVIAKNGRLEFLAEIIAEFRVQLAEKNSELTAIIISATKLSPAIIKNIQSELSKNTKKKIAVEEQIDPKIIGGLVVKIGSKMYDYSVKSQLNKLKNELKQVS